MTLGESQILPGPQFPCLEDGNNDPVSPHCWRDVRIKTRATYACRSFFLPENLRKRQNGRSPQGRLAAPGRFCRKQRQQGSGAPERKALAAREEQSSRYLFWATLSLPHPHLSAHSKPGVRVGLGAGIRRKGVPVGCGCSVSRERREDEARAGTGRGLSVGPQCWSRMRGT